MSQEDEKASEIYAQLNPHIQNILSKIMDKEGPEVFLTIVTNMAVELMTLAMITVRINPNVEEKQFNFDHMMGLLIQDIRARYDTAEASYEMHEKIEKSGPMGMADEMFICRPLN